MAGPVNIAFGITAGSFQTGLDKMGGSVTQFTSLTRNQFASLNNIASAPAGSVARLASQFGIAGKSINPLLSGVGRLGGLGPSLLPITSAIGGLFAVNKILGAGKAITDISGRYEKFDSILTNALQSGSGAKDQLRGLTDFAATTPNQLDELTGSFIKFVNRGLIPSRQQLTNFGDLAASQGKGFDQLTEAILDAQSGEFERLKEFGVRASKSGDQVTLSFKGVTQTVSNTSDEITRAIQKFGQLTGVAGSMNAVAQTQEGLVSNLGDTYDRLLVALGNTGIAGGYKLALGAASSFLTVITDLIAASPAEDLRAQKTEINGLVGAIALANDNETLRLSLIQKLNASYPEFLGKLDAESVTTDLLSKRLADVNAQYDRKIRIALGEEKIKKATEEVTSAIRVQQDALDKLATASGKPITKLERLTSAQRIELAKQIAQQKQASAFQPSYFGQPAKSSFDFLPGALAGAEAKQKTAQAELNRLMGENATRQADLTKTTVDGYQAQIAQIQKKIKLHQIDAKIGTEEIQRLNGQIRVAQGLAPIAPKVTAPDTSKTKSEALKTYSVLDVLQRVVKGINTDIETKRSLGVAVPAETFHLLKETEDQIDRITGKAEKEVKIKPIGTSLIRLNLQGEQDRIATFTQALTARFAEVKKFGSLDFYIQGIGEIQSAVANLSLKGLAVSPETITNLSTYIGQVEKANQAVQSANRAAEEQRLSSLKVAGVQIGGFKLDLFDDSAKTLEERTATLGQNISSAFHGAAAQAAEGMGTLIGGLLMGTASLSQIPAMIGNVFGNLASTMGKSLIAFGTAGLAAKAFVSNPVTAIVAGIALTALGAGLTAALQGQATKLEAGGLATGPTYALIGESARARAGGGEFVSSVTQGANLIGDRIMTNLSLMTQPKMQTFDMRRIEPVSQRTQRIEIGGAFELDGHKLRIALNRADDDNYHLR